MFRGTTATDPTTGNTVYDDGAGSLTVAGPDGIVLSQTLPLGKAVAWNQTPVFIAIAAGLVLGAVGMKLYKKKHR